MEAVHFIYIDNSTGVRYERDFNALKVKGFDPVDSVSNYPDVLHHILDGSLIEQNIGIKRSFTIEIGVVPYADRLFCANFFYARTKWVQYSHDSFYETVGVVNDTNRLETDWLNDVHLARYVVLNLQDRNLSIDFPAVNPNPPVYESGMYLKKHVAITGYVGSAETLTTGTGKLAVCDAPAGSWATFDDTLEKYLIVCDGQIYQDCHFHVTALEVESGGNLSFNIERSDAGNPSADGSYYCDIAIFVQSIL